MYVTLLVAVSATTTNQPNVCDTISSSLRYYKLVYLMYVKLLAAVLLLQLVNLMYVTPLAAVSVTTTNQPNVCDTISSSLCNYN